MRYGFEVAFKPVASSTELIDTEVVSGNYFSELGVKAAVGRTFLPDEDSSLGLHPVTVLSYGFWQHRFGS